MRTSTVFRTMNILSEFCVRLGFSQKMEFFYALCIYRVLPTVARWRVKPVSRSCCLIVKPGFHPTQRTQRNKRSKRNARMNAALSLRFGRCVVCVSCVRCVCSVAYFRCRHCVRSVLACTVFLRQLRPLSLLRTFLRCLLAYVALLCVPCIAWFMVHRQ